MTSQQNSEQDMGADAATRPLGQAASEALDTAIRDTYQGVAADVARLEEKIQEKPLQSVLIAFLSGILLSSLLKRR